MGKPCRDKTGSYPTGAAARKALDQIRARALREEWGKPMRVYPCPTCRKFHLTTEDYQNNEKAKGYWE